MPKVPQVHRLSHGEAQWLEDRSASLVPQLFQSLVGHQRPLLFELACYPNSLLTETVCRMTSNPHAAFRGSDWNGCDLSKTSGVRLAIERVKLERPQHAWISTPCGPYSPCRMSINAQSSRSGNCKKRGTMPNASTLVLSVWLILACNLGFM